MGTKTRKMPQVEERKVRLTPKSQLNKDTSPIQRETLVRPKGSKSYFLMPEDRSVGVELARIEKLITQRHFGQVIKSLDKIKIPESPFKEHYLVRIAEKKIRTLCRIATTYAQQGKLKEAKKYYDKALTVKVNESKSAGFALTFVDKYFMEKTKRRARTIEELVTTVSEGIYEEFCAKNNEIRGDSIVNDLGFRDLVASDHFVNNDLLRRWLEVGKKEGIPGKEPNWIDPVPEMWGTDVGLELPVRPGVGVDFAGVDASFVDIASTVQHSTEKLRATFAMPLISTLMKVYVERFAIDNDVDWTGVKRRIVPLYRYSCLRKQVLALLDRVGDIEQKMVFLQDRVDDFAELVDSINRPLTEKQAELTAVEEQINGALLAMNDLASTRHQLMGIVFDLGQAREDCDVEWWESLLGVLLFFVIIIAGVALGGLLGAGIGYLIGSAAIGAGAVTGMFVGFTAGAFLAFEAVDALALWEGAEITCDNVDAAYNDFSSALKQVENAISVGSTELQVAMARRDLLQTEIAALSSQLQAIYEDNASRHLDADTIQNILGIYEDSRRNLLNQATTIAEKMEASYRFEYGESWRYLTGNAPVFIGNSYEAADGKGYGAREELLKDIEALEFERLSGRTHKAMQLTLPVSLRRHFPSTLAGVKGGGKSSFTLSMERMDRFYPGTYQHRIKEVCVDVIVDGVPSAARGYLSCYGTSQIRFPDPGNKFPVDNKEILPEPDSDIAKLCYKRAWQVGGTESMAFPDLNSPRTNDRIVTRQHEERNFFENLGMEVTWIVEVLPDQNIDMTRVTDIVVTFQIEAEFDDNLRKVIEGKRFENRDEIIAFSAKQMMDRQKRSFDLQKIVFDINQTSLPYAYRDKKIKNIAVYLKPKTEHFIAGIAKISMSLDGGAQVQITTDDKGRAATGIARHAGPDGQTMGDAFHEKNPVGKWQISLDDLPADFNKEDIDDLYLLLRYTYA
jgi:hypothetical protein